MSWYQKLLYGVDLDEEQARSDSLDAQLAALNRAKLNAGTYTPEVFAAAEANREKGAMPDIEADVDQVFLDSVKENAAAIQSGVKETIRQPLTWVLGMIPWQVWLIGLGVLLFYMGGWTYLQGIITRKFKG